ncbi:hypothetical protein ROHU_016353 [Labeo rohita]|uniref:Endoplasmic reticulum transmembrane protein n=1 Tax=Labeo rohita TaxID=84645 RepID=A0A498NK18_LABRO|nr:hypothetical protein ROHU_016353 [Labeo rohita]
MYSCYGKTINEFRLALHAVTTAVCQLYLGLLHLRHAAKRFAEADGFDDNILRYDTEAQRLEYTNNRFRKSTVRFLEGVCLILEALSQCLEVVSALFVAIRHVPQAALFLVVSMVRWSQKMVLYNLKEELDEWESEQKKQGKELQEQIGHLEEYLNTDHFKGKKGR